ncbi:hypothetical protein LCGC14_2490080 [marine sediment metagenome]|uniref:Uncharacterized protein n=1 Tax=marine sediment metagenome TaxID=412755 RepID=A0A0F9B5N5_9ZZZZ
MDEQKLTALIAEYDEVGDKDLLMCEIDKLYKPQPDQSRLLTDEEIKTLPVIDRISKSNRPLWLKRCISVAEVQRDLTASIKDAEWR